MPFAPRLTGRPTLLACHSHHTSIVLLLGMWPQWLERLCLYLTEASLPYTPESVMPFAPRLTGRPTLLVCHSHQTSIVLLAAGTRFAHAMPCFCCGYPSPRGCSDALARA